MFLPTFDSNINSLPNWTECNQHWVNTFTNDYHWVTPGGNLGFKVLSNFDATLGLSQSVANHNELATVRTPWNHHCRIDMFQYLMF